MHRFVYLLSMILLIGCAASTGGRITDDTLNKIAECTGGMAGSAGFMARIEASLKDKKMEIGGSADVNYEEIIKGVIFSDQNISEDMKRFYFTEYQKCLDKNRRKTGSTVNQTMTNSPGAFQAGRDIVVNITPQPRKLTEEQKQKLLRILLESSKGPVNVVAVQGDVDAYDFAIELDALLNSTGWKTQGVSRAMFHGEPRGLIIQVKNQENIPQHAAVLQHALDRVGFKAQGQYQENITENTVTLIIGH